MWAAVREGFSDASAATGVEVKVVFASIRDLPVEMAERAAIFAAEHADDGVAAFGLAGSEHAAEASEFASAAAMAREAGLLVTPHAGELLGARSVAEAIEHLGADRIAHGIRAVEDPDVLRRLAAEGITCDVCLSSNVALGVVDAIDRHPLPHLVAGGVPVSLGADDRLMFGAGTTDQYELAREVFGFSDEQLADIARTSVTASGAEPSIKTRILVDIDAWIAVPAPVSIDA